MSASATDMKWARGYALQSLSDLRAREALLNAKSEKCHRLHFLQMAAEKACKAYLTAAGGHDQVKKSHAYIALTLPVIARHFYAASSPKTQKKEWEIPEVKRIAREIQVLSPACDEGYQREDNSEYPWDDGTGRICIPCEYSYPNIDDTDRSFVRIIQLIRIAAQSYSQ
jgi:hypothetical protein